MRERRWKFTPEFKSEAVRLVVDTSRPIAEACVPRNSARLEIPAG